jgi:hypothetical protein
MELVRISVASALLLVICMASETHAQAGYFYADVVDLPVGSERDLTPTFPGHASFLNLRYVSARCQIEDIDIADGVELSIFNAARAQVLVVPMQLQFSDPPSVGSPMRTFAGEISPFYQLQPGALLHVVANGPSGVQGICKVSFYGVFVD